MRLFAALSAAVAASFAFAAAAGSGGADAQETIAEKMRRFASDKVRLEKALAECEAAADRPALDVRVPVEHHPDGTIKTEVFAGEAQFFDKEGLVWCSGVTLLEYDAAGKEMARFEAGSCIIDRDKKTGFVKGRAKGVFGGTVLAGEGFYFSFPDEFVRICAKVEVVTTDIKFKGMKL